MYYQPISGRNKNLKRVEAVDPKMVERAQDLQEKSETGLGIYRVPMLPGIVSLTFPGLKNTWVLHKKSETPGILTQNL